jgi:hypothetical protein
MRFNAAIDLTAAQQALLAQIIKQNLWNQRDDVGDAELAAALKAELAGHGFVANVDVHGTEVDVTVTGTTPH